jgi:hypothetical protein
MFSVMMYGLCNVPCVLFGVEDLTFCFCSCKSAGERSSQYAAESSCRLRFGPHTNWIGQFDIDEYLIPMGNFSSLLPLLDRLDDEGNKIISFASWRAWPRRTHIK